MRQITIRGFDDKLANHLKKLAKLEHVSLNKAILKLLYKVTNLENQEPPARVVGDALDDFIGIWTEQEKREFDESVKAFQEIDESMWQ